MTRIVGEVMTREVVEAYRGTPFKELVRLLDRHRISGLPVVDHDDKVVGVISGTDLIRRQATRATDGRARRFRLPWPGRSTRRADAVAGATTAAELMSSPAITVHPEQRVGDAARVMERHGVERLPVVDEEDRLIGIATRRDLLRVFLRTDDEIRRDVLDEVVGRGLGLAADSVAVSVRDGVVTLEGGPEQRVDAASAIWLTYRIDGVIGVVNRLNVRVEAGPFSPSKGPTGPGRENP
ncbi:CBS domain-containing protein [Streptomyces sp. NPDC005474]|uniref:CBS domain-containing protein n=1 Tax=Streptomyces sp. NPDC005474 TaxID=3154878 RepID=UPI0034538322